MNNKSSFYWQGEPITLKKLGDMFGVSERTIMGRVMRDLPSYLWIVPDDIRGETKNIENRFSPEDKKWWKENLKHIVPERNSYDDDYDDYGDTIGEMYTESELRELWIHCRSYQMMADFMVCSRETAKARCQRMGLV